MRRAMPSLPPSMVHGVSTLNLAPNPLMVGTGTDPTGSFTAVATGTAPVRSLVADTTGLLPAGGKWAEVDMNAAAVSSFARAFALGSGWAAGDTLAVYGLMQVVDLSGGWEAAVDAGTASVNLMVVDGVSGVGVAGGVAVERCAGRTLPDGSYLVGPALMPFTAPSTSSLTLRYYTNAPAGLHIKARFGAVGVLNLTRMGVDVGGGTMPNV
jgi:hypothetical protein